MHFNKGCLRTLPHLLFPSPHDGYSPQPSNRGLYSLLVYLVSVSSMKRQGYLFCSFLYSHCLEHNRCSINICWPLVKAHICMIKTWLAKTRLFFPNGMLHWSLGPLFKKQLGYDPAITLLGVYPEETKIEKDTCISMFIAGLVTIARTWKQPRCPSTWVNKEVVVHIHNGILLSHKKESIWVSSDEVDEPRTYYTEWSKSERER